ncbi:MAG: helix-turn-helix domain-containing protein [Nocardioidaceae bacterium]
MRRAALVRTRKRAGFSQESLAAALHVDPSSVSNWERGRTEPVAFKRPKLAALLGISDEGLEDLLNGPRSYQISTGDTADLSIDRLRCDLEHVQRDYDVVPSTYLLATASRTHERISALLGQASSARRRREALALQADSAIFMGQLVWDASQRQDHRSPRVYFDQAVRAARRTGDRVTEAYATLRISYLALYGDKVVARGLGDAQQAADIARGASPAMRGLAVLHVAEANAMLGRRRDCDHALGDARDQFALIHDLDIAAEYLTPAELDRMAGSCYLFLGLHHQAEEALRSAATALQHKAKSQSIVLGNLALAYVQQGDLDGAAQTLHRTIDVLQTSRGGGGLTLAFEAGRRLTTWRQETMVQELHERLFTLMAKP